MRCSVVVVIGGNKYKTVRKLALFADKRSRPPGTQTWRDSDHTAQSSYAEVIDSPFYFFIFLVTSGDFYEEPPRLLHFEGGTRVITVCNLRNPEKKD